MQSIPQPKNEDLIVHVTHGVGSHLGQALEALFESTEANIHGKNMQLAARGRRYAMSSAIHSFCAFEHAVNLFMFYTYKQPGNALFRPLETRTVLERRLAQNMQDVDVIGKFEVLSERLTCCDRSKKLLPQLREVREFRNRLCHGFTEEKHSLVQLVPGTEKRQQTGTTVIVESIYTTVECEYSPGEKKKPWEKIVPITKLHHPDTPCEADAFKVFWACASGIDFLGMHLGLEFGAEWYFKNQRKLVALGRKSAQVPYFHELREPISDVKELFLRRQQYYSRLNAKSI